MKYYYSKIASFLVYRVNTANNTVQCYGADEWSVSGVDPRFIPNWLPEITLEQAKKIYPNIS